MLRVCGVTFDHTTNYGSCLQAYALQTVTDDMTVHDEPCRYALLPAGVIRQKDPKQPASKGLPWVRAKNRVLREFYHYRRKKFERFEAQNVHYADCTDRQQLAVLNRDYDAFVCGSDVIWNLSFTHADPIYFLEFAEKYKFSYAASFGVMDIHKDFKDLREDPEAIFQKYLPRLNRISVREKSATDIAGRITGEPGELVCDPVLLLTKEQWSRAADRANGKKAKGHYIFAYSTYLNGKFTQFVRQLQQQTHLPVIQVTWDIKGALKNGLLFSPGPDEWLKLIRDADYVVTNSFHGIAFCCIFHKTFFFPLRDEAINRTGIRLSDFLQYCGLEDRMIVGTRESIDLSPPDYASVDSRLDRLRTESLTFLRRNLEAAYEEKQQREQKGSEQ